MYVDEQTYLEHYGVKGMRWGVRRYDDDNRVRQAKSRYDKVRKTKGQTASEKRIAKKEYEDTKTLARIDDKGLSKREQKLYSEYKSKGLSDREAKLSAAQRVKTEKILAVLGGASVGVAAAYLAKSGYYRNIDGLIKAGTKIQNINTHNPAAIKDAFYGSFKKGDMKRYKFMYANQLKNGIFANPNSKVYNTTVEATKDIKVASEKAVKRAIKDIQARDGNYLGYLRNNIEQNMPALTPKAQMLKNKALRDLSNYKVTNAVVKAQNITIPAKNTSVNKELFNELKKRGYGAVRDVNDMSFSGYKTKAPTVFFDTAKTAVREAKVLNDDVIAKKGSQEMAKLIVQKYAKESAQLGGVIAAGKAVSSQRARTQDNKAIQAYRKEHPNTSMSDYDILRMIEKNKK